MLLQLILALNRWFLFSHPGNQICSWWVWGEDSLVTWAWVDWGLRVPCVVWSVESVRSLVLIEIINTSSADTYQLNQSKSLWKQCTNRYQNHVKCNPMFLWKCDLVNCFVSFLIFKNIENGFGFLNFSFIWIHFGVQVTCMILVLCS